MAQYTRELSAAEKLNTIQEDNIYHPMSTSVYPANFDGSNFEKYKMNEFNRLTEDECYNTRRVNDNNKKLKFMTTNHIDLLKAKETYNFFGIGVRDTLFVPGNRIDSHSDLLNGKNGGTLTNCNVKNGFGQLPVPTTPFRGQLQHGDVIIEDSMRNVVEPKKNSCLPKDNEYQKRSFDIFDDSLNIEVPRAIKSVETPQIGFALGRNGENTRYNNKFESTKIYNADGKNFHAANKFKY